MLALSLGLLFVMATTAALLADMERKRRTIVDLLDQLSPLVARSRRLAMANLRRLSRSPVQAYTLIDALEREIGLVESEHDVPPLTIPAADRSSPVPGWPDSKSGSGR